MREVLACLAAVGLMAACAKAPPTNAATAEAHAAPAAAASTGPAVSGVYMAGGKPATLTDVSAHADDPFDGKPVTAIVFTAKPQAGDADPLTDAHQGALGDAIIVRVQPDGTVIGSDLVHSGLAKSGGYISGVGMVTLKDYRSAGGEISGRLTSDGPGDAMGQPINVDLSFRVKAP